jgi:WD40 repeat protein
MSKSKSSQKLKSLWRGQLSEYITSIAWSKDGESLVASSAGGEGVLAWRTPHHAYRHNWGDDR